VRESGYNIWEELNLMTIKGPLTQGFTGSHLQSLRLLTSFTGLEPVE
jgi:hypothetical protein